MERRNSVNQIKSLAYSAGRNISMDPERYGEHMLDALEQELQVFLAKLPEEVREHYEAAYIEKYSLWLSAMSRCFSQFITGAGGWKPATFRRHEKTNQAEHNARVRLDEWADKVVKRCNRQHRLTGWDEVERLQDKVEKLTALQEMMKAANKVIRCQRSSRWMSWSLSDSKRNRPRNCSRTTAVHGGVRALLLSSSQTTMRR